MGGVKDEIFGAKSKEKSESGNLNNDLLTGSLSPALGYVTGGGNMVGNLLGVGGAPAQTDALENFANSGGMKFLEEQGMKGITSSKAASGLLASGSYGTALSKYNQGLASTYLNQYMQNLLDYSRLGLGSAGVLASSGAYSKGSGTGPKQGLLSSFAEGAGKAAAAGGGGG
jgi:hypothetical protein